MLVTVSRAADMIGGTVGGSGGSPEEVYVRADCDSRPPSS
jgi:hypothetical protein